MTRRLLAAALLAAWTGTATAGSAPPSAGEPQHLIEEARAVLEDSVASLEWLSQIDFGANVEEHQQRLVGIARRCEAEMTRLLALGVDTDVILRFRLTDVKIAEARKKVCAPLAKASGITAREATREQRQAQYKGAGFTGDRLAFVLDNDVILGAGGKALASLDGRKSARVMFVKSYKTAAAETVMLTRFVFRGDKLVSSATKTYPHAPGSAAYR